MRRPVLDRGIEQPRIQPRLIRKQQQPLAIRIEPPQWIDIFGKPKVRQRPILTPIRRKLGKHPVRFMKCNQHPRSLPQNSPTANLVSMVTS